MNIFKFPKLHDLTYSFKIERRSDGFAPLWDMSFCTSENPECVDGDLRRNVVALLSLERYKDHDRLEPAAVQRLYNRIDDEVRAALRPYGYYDPKISSSIEPPDKERHWHVGITIDPGPPVLIDAVNVQVSGAGASDPVFTRISAAVAIQIGRASCRERV